MGSFMRLIGDDYCYAATLRHFGFWLTQWQSYVAIGGYNGNRYSLNLFSSLVDLFGPHANAVIPGLAILLWLTSLAWAWRNGTRLAGIHAFPLAGLLWAEILVFFTLSLAPDLDQSLYWRTGMLTYLAPVITGSILLGLILWQSNRSKTQVSLLGATSLLALLSAGFSEVGAVAHVTSFACLLSWAGYIAWRQSRKLPRNNSLSLRLIAPTTSALAGSLAALLVLSFAPSTQLRMQAIAPPASLLSTLQIALYSTRIFVISVTIKRLLLPNLLLFCIALAGSILLAAWTKRNESPRLIMSTRSWLLSLVGIFTTGLIIVFACMLPNAYVQSGYPELRALIIPRVVLLASIAGGGWLTGRFVYSQMARRSKSTSHVVSLLAGLILVVAIVAPLGSTGPILSRAPLFAKWSQLWDQRDQEIRYAASYNQGSLRVMELEHIIPRVGELQVGSWYTQCADQYYGIQILPNLPGWDQDNSP